MSTAKKPLQNLEKFGADAKKPCICAKKGHFK
jgi:hypothetical protein